MRVIGGRLAGLGAVLLLCCGTAVGCAGPGQRELDWDDRIVDARASGALGKSLDRLGRSSPGFPGVPLRRLTDFAWDGLFLFEQGLQGKDVRAKTGFTFMPDEESVEEDNELLVFVKGSKVAKVVLFREELRHPLAYTSGKKYSSEARLLRGDSRVLDVVEPNAFQRVFDSGIAEHLSARYRALRDGNRTSVPLADLGFTWDEMRVVEPAQLKKETGLSYKAMDYWPPHSAFMVFRERDRVVRIGEMDYSLFPREDRKGLRGREWSSKVQVVVTDRKEMTLTLREP
ncbi:hypothetical protein [Spirillospora sp. NPDC029432]|uniref:hypothetical protein n=1 Tax=Spirillospora sp. NPDC029432 TaxID=3154599 RepID=UPI003455603A